ncbi:MAG: hypothetical protein ABIO48_11005 [Pedococcus sp.]
MGNTTEHAPEAQTVRQYRYLLRTAPTEGLEAVHGEALAQLSDADREAVLTAVQEGLVAGARLAPSDIAKIGHLLTLGERRTPGAFSPGLPPLVIACPRRGRDPGRVGSRAARRL